MIPAGGSAKGVERVEPVEKGLEMECSLYKMSQGNYDGVYTTKDVYGS